MDSLSDSVDFQDEPIDPELRTAIKEHSSPIRITKHSNSSNNDTYNVLSSDDIVQYVVDFVQEVNCILQLKTTVTRMLLSYCKWDKILLMEKFYNDSEKLFKEAHVINPFNVSNNTIADSQNNECEICYAELSSGSTATNACGHKFCTLCWSEYLKVKIMDEGVGNSILCAATDCDVIIDDETVIELVDDTPAKLRYQHLITNSFVQQNLLLRWCPAPGCSFAIKVDFSPFKPISCSCKCGHEFCFDCGEQWHGPVPCELLKRFNGHLKEGIFHPFVYRNRDSGYDNKIKCCPNPNCTVSIQKIFGCPVMQCKNCNTIFCWDCLTRYKTKAAVYQHWCRGESRPPQRTETLVQSDETELAPPHKYAKLSENGPGGSTAHRSKTKNESSLPRKVEATSTRPGPSGQSVYRRSERTKKKKTFEQQIDIEMNGRGIVDEEEIDFTGFPLVAHYLMPPLIRPDSPIITRRYDPNIIDMDWKRDLQPVDDPITNQKQDQLNIPIPLGSGGQIRLGRYKFGQLRRPMDLVRPDVNPTPTGNAQASIYFNKYNIEDAHLKGAITQSTQIKEALRKKVEQTSNLAEFELASIFYAQSRQTLKYSAIFAMYLRNVNESLIFKNLYNDLEIATNALSNSMTYVNVELKESHSFIPEMVLPAYRNCKLRRRALLEYIDDGYDHEWWIFEDQPT